jgi:hypothetical protein
MITRSAYASMIAASSGVTLRTGRSLASPAPRVEPPFSAPKRMFATERPMARAISSVRNVPEEPTSVPATSRRRWSST